MKVNKFIFLILAYMCLAAIAWNDFHARLRPVHAAELIAFLLLIFGLLQALSRKNLNKVSPEFKEMLRRSEDGRYYLKSQVFRRIAILVPYALFLFYLFKEANLLK